MFKLINEEEVLDTSTKLVWRRSPEPQLYTWMELAEEDFGIWRVPDIGELFTLVDHHKTSPAANELFNFESKEWCIWSASSYAGHPYSAWCVDFSVGSTFHRYKRNNSAVRLVRNT
jgi:hypothetical protein